MIDFPASPTLGQQFTAAGVTWTWDGAKWLPNGLAPTVVPGIRENRIINGDMRIDQRNGGASGTAQGYCIDRWSYVNTTAPTGRGTWQRASAGAPLVALGFGYALTFTSSSAYASAAADQFAFYQPVEADMVSDFAWGTPNAQPVTLSFWVLSSLTGTFGGSLRNYPTNNRSYPFSFSIPVASTWTKIVVTIPGDTAGAWVMSGNAGALSLSFDLGCGANFRGPANAWAGASYAGVTGAVSIVGTNGAGISVTGVKLEIGSVATPFNRQSLAKSMADCQRYYQVGTLLMTGYSSAAGQGFSTSTMAPVVMRLPGPWALTVASSGNSNWTMSGLNYNSVGCFISSGVAIAAGAIGININFTANAEL